MGYVHYVKVALSQKILKNFYFSKINIPSWRSKNPPVSFDLKPPLVFVMVEYAISLDTPNYCDKDTNWKTDNPNLLITSNDDYIQWSGNVLSDLFLHYIAVTNSKFSKIQLNFDSHHFSFKQREFMFFT